MSALIFLFSKFSKSCFHVKYQNNNKSLLVFHFSAWKPLAGCLQNPAKEVKEKCRLGSHYPLMETLNHSAIYFGPRNTRFSYVFLFPFSDINYCDSEKTQASPKKEIIEEWYTLCLGKAWNAVYKEILKSNLFVSIKEA